MKKQLIERINRSLYIACKSDFYKKKGITSYINELNEFESILPTTKEELRQSGPYELLSANFESVEQYHESFGTTGKPVPVWYTKNDFQTGINQMLESAFAAKSDDVVIVRYPYALSTPAHLFSGMMKAMGAAVIPISRGSLVTPYPRVLEIMKRVKATVLACNPSEAIILADIAVRLGYDLKKDFPIRVICAAGEMLCPERRKYIENIWNAKIYNFYGSTEASNKATSCDYGELHCSDDFYFETVDSQTGKPLQKGQKGLLLITQLNNEAFPLIRYNTGDIVEIKENGCECRSPKDVLIHHGRETDIITVNGKSCTMYEFQQILYRCKEISSVNYWKVKVLSDKVNIYIEGNPKETNVEWKLELPFEHNIIVVEKGKLYDIDGLIKITELKKANYFI